MNERILALDIGDVRIGVAVSDMTRTIATPVEVIKRVGFGPDVKRISALCQQYETTEILSGLPLNMDGTEGFQAQKVKLLCEQLEKAGFTVYYQDERLTTVTAEEALLEDNMHRAERKQNVDKVAAAIILQQWLDTQKAAPAADVYESEEQTMEENNNLIELIDEEGNPTAFELLANIELEGKEYLALTPAAEDDDEECEVFFMSIETDENEEEYYEPVEDEELQERLFDDFLKLIESDEEEAE